ncbi:DUF5776 domain-containing protein [Lentilactobacillus sp. SPB1-3]|uniref:DUF5776 domain-containing protein n=1 Tax=Lentilactobacillus terminaliae TaxID=3003483 RepID=A0ACD5DBV4_9LACO|nr:DUF5776 domain-containing protein [Lentilactobacillus sp. SPB1-3]MCZ0977135.1 DUF5776 domain-containing protein [Lentilactobacillus sp. SPB1-3]
MSKNKIRNFLYSSVISLSVIGALFVNANASKIAYADSETGSTSTSTIQNDGIANVMYTFGTENPHSTFTSMSTNDPDDPIIVPKNVSAIQVKNLYIKPNQIPGSWNVSVSNPDTKEPGANTIDPSYKVSNILSDADGTIFHFVFTPQDNNIAPYNLYFKYVNVRNITATDGEISLGDNLDTSIFNASATLQDGSVNDPITSFNIPNLDSSKAGTYDVTITSRSGQTKTVKLTVNGTKKSFTASDATITVGDKFNIDIFKAKATNSDGSDDPITSYSPDPVDTSKLGDQQITLITKSGQQKTVKLTVQAKPTAGGGSTGNNNPSTGSGTVTTPSQPSTPAQPVQPSQPVLPTPSVPGNDSTGLPNWAAVKGQSIYGIKGFYLYSDTNFYTNERIKHYAKTSRVNRPQFIVKGYNYDDNGKLRYKVQQYNPYKGKYVAGTKGYITANEKYVVKAYYATTPKNKRIKVINKNGVKSYRNVKLSDKAKLYKQGSTLKVKSIKKYKLATRYRLTNGQYVTGNKKFIIWK